MVPPLATTDHVGRKTTMLPSASLPTALNCCVALMPIVTGLGVTAIVASAPAVTATVAVPATAPAVNRPVLLIAPPLATTDHVGANATMLPEASLPTAVNCCVVLMPIVTGLGVTAIVASGPAVTATVAVPATAPFDA